ncbi:MAG TPA: NAD kinase [Alphaproteobacteria bacterium]|nr:NAD kinase [Alphaproteobacteria bacterium]
MSKKSGGMKIAFVAARTATAKKARVELVKRYGHTPPHKADVIVALGGDGFMLETLHRYIGEGAPIYGMNRGTVGFVLNQFRQANLPERIAQAERVTLHPLRMMAETIRGKNVEALAINEVALLRESRQAAKVKISVDEKVRLEELICDGILVCTPAGSTAYNLSAHGSIIPLGSNILGMTPISAFRPRRWRGALLPSASEVTFEIIEPVKRPVSATADFTEVRDVKRVFIAEERNVSLHLLFDREHNLEERILTEQFWG